MRGYRWQLGAALVGLAAGLGAGFPVVARGQPQSPFIGLDEIQAKLDAHQVVKGYGLTTFQGAEPQRFDVEVIGILHNFRPAENLIVTKTTGGPDNRVDIVKTVAGMSGSPVYFDGRLAGAYAWRLAAFNVEPIAGITPIALMLPEMTRPIPPGYFPLEEHKGQPLAVASPLPAVGARTRLAARPPRQGGTTFDGPPGGYDYPTHAAELASRFRGGGLAETAAPASTPMLLGGVGDRTAEYLRRTMEPMGLDVLQGGGAATNAVPSGPMHYVGGGGLGVPLASGDVSMTAIGTTTYANGTKIAGFGHPMYNAGDSAIPTCVAQTLWIMASAQASFKLGECVRPLGALVQDRPNAIVIDETKVAPTFPVDVTVTGVPGLVKTKWHADVADEKFTSPSLVATIIGSVVEMTTSERRDLTWNLHSRVFVHDHGILELDDFGVAVGGTPDTPEWFQTRAVRAVGNVMNNPWQEATVDRVESTLDVHFTRDVWRLRGVELLDPVVDAGEKARVRLRLLPFAGPEVDRTVEVTLPVSLAGKDVDLEILPGYELAPDVSAPENLEELLANEQRQSYDAHTVVVQYKVPQQGIAFGGHIAPELPSFAIDALRPTATDVAPDAFTSYVRASFPMEKFFDGHDKVRVHVRSVMR